jgi:hypothetical protein
MFALRKDSSQTMNIQFPPLLTHFKILSIAVVAGLLAYFVSPALGVGGWTAQMALTVGMVAGVVVGGYVVSLSKGGEPVDAEEQTVFVGNLPFKASEQDVRALFTPFGEVKSVRLMTDRVTRRPRGYGFVRMSRGGARTAIKRLNGTPFEGRTLKVNEAHERKAQEPERTLEG